MNRFALTVFSAIAAVGAASAAAVPASANPNGYAPFSIVPSSHFQYQPRRYDPAAVPAYRYEQPRRSHSGQYAARGPVQGAARSTTREVVAYNGPHAAGTIVISTSERRLYLVLGNGRALRYIVGVGREGFQWSGRETISNMQEWPGWTPPDEMLRRQPYLPRYMAGGPGNPLGARALYLGGTLYRIHGSNEPDTIGQAVSSGCIRMLNEDVVDLYQRVRVGTPVVVLR